MAWIESHEEIGEHHKIHKLAEQLNMSVPTAVGTVHLLWHYTIKVAWQTGDLTRQTPRAIARAVWYNGQPTKLINALNISGFMDGMKVHDWEIYANHLIYQRLYNSRRKDKKGNTAVNTAVDTPVNTDVVKATTRPDLTRPNLTKPDSQTGRPSFLDVKNYCLEAKLRVDPERFFHHYESMGWVVGGAEVKNWKALLKKWNAFEKKDQAVYPKPL